MYALYVWVLAVRWFFFLVLVWMGVIGRVIIYPLCCVGSVA
jgi:hypothetical protein